MENIIKKAQKGGYKEGCKLVKFYVYSFTHLSPNGFNELEIRYSDMFMGHLFWQSLSKACGWHFCRVHTCGAEEEICSETGHDEWVEKSLRFHEINLTEGWDAAVSWLENLIK